MALLKISSPTSSNFTEEEIDYFSDTLTHDLQNKVQIEKVSPQERGRGVIYWELLQVWIEDIPEELREYLIKRILEYGIRTIKKSFRRMDKRPGRPNAVVIYDKEGNEVEAWVISNSRQKPRTKEEFQKFQEKKSKKSKNKKGRKKK